MAHSGYEDLLSVILTPEDRNKFEQFIGQALSDGPTGCLVIEGSSATGKSTLIEIAAMILKDIPGISYRHDGFGKSPLNSKYTFVAIQQRSKRDEPNAIMICTTGNTMPVGSYHGTMLLIGSELVTISRLCVEQYRRLTENNQEK